MRACFESEDTMRFYFDTPEEAWEWANMLVESGYTVIDYGHDAGVYYIITDKQERYDW